MGSAGRSFCSSRIGMADQAENRIGFLKRNMKKGIRFLCF
jgi:hypothetical protein